MLAIPIVAMANANGGVIMKAEVSIRLVPLASFFFGKNPQRFFSRARTRFIRYEGTEEKVGTEMNVVKEKSAVSLPRETITI